MRLRADRLGVLGPELLILPETSTEGIVRAVKDHKPDLLFVDSIQTLHTLACGKRAGQSVAQVRESTAELILAAKPLQLPVVLIGHITKEGAIAGPKVLEHMVDVVLTFEGDRHHAYRILRAVKEPIRLYPRDWHFRNAGRRPPPCHRSFRRPVGPCGLPLERHRIWLSP